MNTITEAFWSDLNGRIVCDKHLGNEASHKLAKRPTAKIITTSMTQWFRMYQDQVTAFAEICCLENTICESCRGGR